MHPGPSRTIQSDGFEIPRARMVEHLRNHYQIADERVLDAMNRVPRHAFVPHALQAQAYKDNALPISAGQTISQPFIVARMTELLELKGRERVLEIGSGSGYQTAVLATVAFYVDISLVPGLVGETYAYSDLYSHYGPGAIDVALATQLVLASPSTLVRRYCSPDPNLEK